jgi:hypothetical protein
MGPIPRVEIRALEGSLTRSKILMEGFDLAAMIFAPLHERGRHRRS